MLHSNRRHNVADVDTPEELARKLTENTWTLCTGFRHAGYLWLNDSTSEDSAAEYGVVEEKTGVQVESITVSWCTYDKVLSYVKRAGAGEFAGEDIGTHNTQPHGDSICHLCA